MGIAIITGASSGLGREYARIAAGSGRYEELWLIARREDRLRELAAELGVPTRVVTLDLLAPDAMGRMEALLAQATRERAGLSVGLLVNAAGFGKFGTCDDLSRVEVDGMVRLNCGVLVDMTQLCLPLMRRGSRILQVASTASFAPLPGLGVYAASKVFVRSYTRSLRFELRGRGIFVTAVCPIWIRTEFMDVARRTANGTTVRHPMPTLSPRRVAWWSMLVNRCNYPIATCCVTGAILRILAKVIPDPILMWGWEGLRRL